MKRIIMVFTALVFFISCSPRGDDTYLEIRKQIQCNNYELAWKSFDSLKVINPQFAIHDTTLSVLEKDLIHRTIQCVSNIISNLPTQKFESTACSPSPAMR